MSLSAALAKWTEVGGQGIQVNQPVGFCNAMSKHWISLRQLDTSATESIMDFATGESTGYSEIGKEFGEKYDFSPAMKKKLRKNQRRHPISHRIPHMEPTKVGHRSTFGSGNIHSRDDVLDLIIANPGLYLYSFSASPWSFSSGHAMAFDTREFAENRVLHFMDPNFGLIWHDDADEKVEAAFRGVYRKYWQGMYKNLAHFGGRKLYSYVATKKKQFSSEQVNPLELSSD
jgi:hypothetical protein